MHKNILSTFVYIFTFIMLSGCGDKSSYVLLQSNTPVTSEKNPSNESHEYIILPQDRLQISLYRNPELTGESSYGTAQLGQDMQKNGVLVDAAGYISLPLIGKVHVAGMSQTKLSSIITEKYKRYLRIPTVYVEVLNKRVYVIGEVNHPGPVKLDREKLTVLEALAFAGDLTDFAVRDNIIILSKNSENKLYMRKVDLTDFDTLLSQNMILRPNDVIYVQPNGWKEFKVNSDNFTTPFETIAKIASPFVTLKYLAN